MNELLSALPSPNGMAFIFVQHSAPSREGLLTEILSRATPMSIVEISPGLRIQPDHAFVAPPGALVDLVDDVFQVTRDAGPSRKTSIDHLFEGLAGRYRNRVVGVVLSGTMSDGAEGLRAIKAAGGVTFAQDEGSAKYAAMPHAAAGIVDLILPPAQIAKHLSVAAEHALIEDTDAEDDPEPGNYQRILTMLRMSTGVNFSLYRQSTIRRRILRRMAVNRIHEIERYTEFVKDQPDELMALYEDILITVTSFFRDPETFEALKQRVFPAILGERQAQSPVRIWIPGCSTGEEVYSLAIALLETMTDRDGPIGIQIFGTDISERAISRARSGVYLESSLQSVSPERRHRFFSRVAGGYQITKAVRDVCVFARQNVAADPPFSNLDLVSCRNLLIYLEPGLQSRVIRLFHYALKSTGFLLLGGSESITTFPDLFLPFDRHHRIFTKAAAAPRQIAEVSVAERPAPAAARRETQRGREEAVLSLDLQRRVDRLVLGAYAPPGVLVNDAFEVLQFRGRTSPYLEPAPGAASLNVLRMARDGLLVDLRAALMQARKTGMRVRAEGLSLRQDDGVLAANLEVIPLREEGTESRLFLVLFESVETRPGVKQPRLSQATGKAKGRIAHDAIMKLEHELAATKEYLQSIIEEQQASNEELKSANEEILSSNEELQSTNEELETTKEELQSTNEELSIVNEQLHNRNDELSRAYEDTANLLQGLDLAVVMLAADGTIRHLTSVAERLLDLTSRDIGRRLSDLRTSIPMPDLPGLVARTIETALPTEFEVMTGAGHWYQMRMRPYRSVDNRIEGVVLGFFDIDPLKRTVGEVTRSREYAESLVETLREGIVVLDESLLVRSANGSFHRMFRTTPKLATGVPFFELPEIRGRSEALRERLEVGGAAPLVDLSFDLPIEGSLRRFIVNAAKLADGGAGRLTLIAFEDVTDRARLADQIREIQKLESIGTLAGGVAHDFNNILNIISAYAALAERHRGDAAKQRESLLAIESAVRRGSGVVRQLLTFARHTDAAPTILRLGNVVAEVAGMIRETFPRNITLSLEVDDKVPAFNADPNQMHQALLNLCVNARDAMPDGGTLGIRTEVASGAELRDRHVGAIADLYAVLHVSDTGMGIDPATRKHIFEPFFTTKPKGLGNGLGLAVVFGMVNSLRGLIEVESELGRGSTFSLYFPISGEAGVDAPFIGPMDGKYSGTETLLVVEDEASLRAAATELLEGEGYAVIAVGDGQQAIQTFAERGSEIAGVILDLGLPGLSGQQVFRRLSEMSDGKVRCVVVSGNLEKRERVELEGAGVLALIGKPYSSTDLLRTVRLVLDGKGR